MTDAEEKSAKTLPPSPLPSLRKNTTATKTSERPGMSPDKEIPTLTDPAPEAEPDLDHDIADVPILTDVAEQDKTPGSPHSD
ncbi:MAG: hypothetical protein DRR06_04230 [Gammaproteobacteria bacterium]|nr:MAG: hypothetical protein DRR06_04230 [Gammaproteobacteria bacterium]RLA53466.1 MAG: hypothetical protein DRR42_04755 [Gammaproteobacteria bacterium]